MSQGGLCPPDRRLVMRRYAALGVLLAVGLTGCTVEEAEAPPPAESEYSDPAVNRPEARQSDVLAQLETVAVKGRAPRTGYDRDHFGRGWKDPDRNGCDARNDILRRDLEDAVAKPGTQGCVILSGHLEDPFTGEIIEFVRGQDTSTEVQIDHVVALSDAWQKGAQLMDPDERVEFANDPLNLLAVDGPTNSAKGDGDAATWLPPNRGFRCDYVARQTAVKVKYELWVTSAERDAIRRIVTTQCPE
ncbi:HNH endonuclease family protein [Citricoccus sp. NPDC055426]|uniref:HNH endonuclease family protein n=1 Tax=Citricoccus sp. NPDC055426 TaxID=3155536 RepID=UPI00341A0EFA